MKDTSRNSFLVESLKYKVKRLVNGGILSWYVSDEMGWVRIFGYGISWKNVDRVNLNFSERYGYTTYWQIRNWVFTYLPK